MSVTGCSPYTTHACGYGSGILLIKVGTVVVHPTTTRNLVICREKRTRGGQTTFLFLFSLIHFSISNRSLRNNVPEALTCGRLVSGESPPRGAQTVRDFYLIVGRR